jgi:putative hydrolase of the HAD superfamily
MQRRRTPHTPTLLIDAMGTLVTLRDPVPALRESLARRLGLDVDPSQARDALRAEVAYYRAHLQDGRDAEALAGLRARCAAVLAAHLPAAAARAAPELMTEILLAALRFAAFPDAAPALRRVRATGSRIVVVSNWDVSLLAVLEETGLAPLLNGVVTSAAAGVRKPDPAIFAIALALAGACPHQAVHVGDSSEEDVAGARAAGVAAVLLDRGGTGPTSGSPPPVERITTLAALAWPPAGGVRGC